MSADWSVWVEAGEAMSSDMRVFLLCVFVALVYFGCEQFVPWLIACWRDNHRQIKVRDWKRGREDTQ